MFSKFFNSYISQKKFYFLLLFLGLSIFLWKNIDVSIMIFVALIFATALNPLVEKLTPKMSRPVAVSIVLLGFFAVVSIFILPILYLSIYEITVFAKEFPQYINDIHDFIQNIPVLNTMGISKFLDSGYITNALVESSTDIFGSIINFATGASEAILYIFTTIVLLFFFMLDSEKIKNAVTKLFPSQYREKTRELMDTVCEKLSGYVFAQTVVSGSVWITMTIGLLIFKINYAVLLGLIAGILSIIPIIGSGISLIICLIATCESGIKILILVTVIYTLSHFIENHLVRPYVYSKFLDLHQAIIFLALFIGAKYQGVLGVILAPPFAMALYILLDELYIKKMEEVETENN